MRPIHLMSSTVSFWYRVGVVILHNKLNCSSKFAHLKWTLYHLLNSVFINSHNKFDLKANLHSNRLMPPSRSELMFKFSTTTTATTFSKVPRGSQVFGHFANKATHLGVNNREPRGSLQLGYTRESLPQPDCPSNYFEIFLWGAGGAGSTAAYVSLCWQNAVAFIKNEGSCKNKNKKIWNNPFPPPILLCGMNLHCS